MLIMGWVVVVEPVLFEHFRAYTIDYTIQLSLTLSRCSVQTRFDLRRLSDATPYGSRPLSTLPAGRLERQVENDLGTT